MENQHLCLYCSQRLLRHISHQGIYWFCSHCHQEIPDIENLREAKLSLQNIICNQFTQHKHSEEKWLQTQASDRLILHEQLLQQTKVIVLDRTEVT